MSTSTFCNTTHLVATAWGTFAFRKLGFDPYRQPKTPLILTQTGSSPSCSPTCRLTAAPGPRPPRLPCFWVGILHAIAASAHGPVVITIGAALCRDSVVLSGQGR
ncbi:hypothetical protein P8C59_003067 [Phyllachora maydis]|uniref:Uncharacterized protein n=1 Tax=Phyllachora maydis TaxID=1825666 RepID=A0AAD9MCY7_9PEZI|nr:hypothetical protein P8C59_003067 [Phyllachora maydis]